MLMRPAYGEAEAEAKNIFKAEVEANNYDAEASCLLLLQEVNFQYKNLENI